ncbi:MAG: class I mannose-6-phosphate isomerase [Lentimicrobiaceae bacterium]|jgi:mannose-6-phosphate isomerase|nr:class I mannose-6-phosphate isomerase [Lentimicrobiaceae bacterium]MBT3455403.1 class I mannose-6-phosphate isomerase [Lentimicrobiaceae bacterium]MBT3818757.1 class I mannose-6-phosphate isomerase [Lentimicrobiaceae bacterium]MBT4062024.1 class I mannose-6-phosphate isomerase [Lentimicrobiaceae bacterium]MBT4190844.1 class I mannose-6-phosphate isomerase [Lentimicrobiaceae bacterium]
MNSLYPLKFKPIFKDKIWGGQKIKTELGLDYGNLPNCGEAWMVSGVKGNLSVVSNGFLKNNELNELVEIYMADLVGEKVFDRFGEEFPLLIKFIDANDWLSIQVHPDDKLAKARKVGNGKTEMWYTLGADKTTKLISGFNREMDKTSYLDHLKKGSIKEIMNFEDVNKGDVFFMPAGRVHAIGPGMLLAEIQQTSDTTYRIYDWDRIGVDGHPRELHNEEAIDAIDFKKYDKYKTDYDIEMNIPSKVVDCDKFTTNVLEFDKPITKDIEALDSFIIYIAIEGKSILVWENGEVNLNLGEAILVPAYLSEISLVPKTTSRLLEVFL